MQSARSTEDRFIRRLPSFHPSIHPSGHPSVHPHDPYRVSKTMLASQPDCAPCLTRDALRDRAMEGWMTGGREGGVQQRLISEPVSVSLPPSSVCSQRERHKGDRERERNRHLRRSPPLFRKVAWCIWQHSCQSVIGI